MGVCGSCGMMVNGEPKLTCATFLRDYAPGPIRVEPLAQLPGRCATWSSSIDDFMRQAARASSRGSSARRRSRCREGEYLQTPEQLDEYKQFSMCINCMLCYAACPVYGLEPEFVGPAAIALAQRYNLDSRDEGAHERLRRARPTHEGIWGCTFVGECTGSARSTSTRPAPSSATSSPPRETLKAFLLPRGAR